MKLSEELAWRGFVNQTTLNSIEELDKAKFTFYFGVDPSASSMQIGNLAAAMMVKHFIDAGHKALLLIGGATGLIGDPDGKASERELKSIEQIEKNKKSIVDQYKIIFAGQNFEVVDNLDWFARIGYIDFLREVGKHVPMRQMLGRDFVQQRLSEGGAGISYAEFSYVLMQAYDFLHLNKTYGVSLQLCGSDQWGNSIAGVDLIRRAAQKEAHVWSAPLVVDKSTGKKFGKSEAGAVWLDPKLTSPYKFYQFWLNVDDKGAEEYLKIFTLLKRKEIEEIIEEFSRNPQDRLAQKTLAREVTSLIHGKAKTRSVMKATEVLFGGGSITELDGDDMQLLCDEVATVSLVPTTGKKETNYQTEMLSGAIYKTGLSSSLGEARRLIQSGAVSVNGEKVSEDFIIKETSLIKKGKNSFAVIKKAD